MMYNTFVSALIDNQQQGRREPRYIWNTPDTNPRIEVPRSDLGDTTALVNALLRAFHFAGSSRVWYRYLRWAIVGERRQVDTSVF